MVSYVTDDHYFCFYCNKALVYDGWQKIVVEVEGHKEHFCPPTTTHHKLDIGLKSQRDERRAQQELYGRFESSAQFTKQVKVKET